MVLVKLISHNFTEGVDETMHEEACTTPTWAMNVTFLGRPFHRTSHGMLDVSVSQLYPLPLELRQIAHRVGDIVLLRTSIWDGPFICRNDARHDQQLVPSCEQGGWLGGDLQARHAQVHVDDLLLRGFPNALPGVLLLPGNVLHLASGDGG